jgi:hypothetical protein
MMIGLRAATELRIQSMVSASEMTDPECEHLGACLYLIMTCIWWFIIGVMALAAALCNLITVDDKVDDGDAIEFDRYQAENTNGALTETTCYQSQQVNILRSPGIHYSWPLK